VQQPLNSANQGGVGWVGEIIREDDGHVALNHDAPLSRMSQWHTNGTQMARFAAPVASRILRQLDQPLGSITAEPDTAEAKRMLGQLDGLAAIVESHFTFAGTQDRHRAELPARRRPHHDGACSVSTLMARG
jgi:hypothetical protein